MNENAKAWLAALRSGQFKQGRGLLTLRTPDGEWDCCLGVACKLAVKAGVINLEIPINVGHRKGSIGYGEEGYDSILPPQVQKWLGLTSENGQFFKVPTIKNVSSLAGLNDTENYTFEQIADFIEQHADELFVPEAQ